MKVWLAEYDSHDGAEVLSVHRSEDGALASCREHADECLDWRPAGSRWVADLTDYEGYVVRPVVLRD